MSTYVLLNPWHKQTFPKSRALSGTKLACGFKSHNQVPQQWLNLNSFTVEMSKLDWSSLADDRHTKVFSTTGCPPFFSPKTTAHHYIQNWLETHRGLYQLSPGNRDAVHRICLRERITWFHQEQLLSWVLMPKGPPNETQRNRSAIKQLHTSTHIATECSVTLLVMVDRLRNAGNSNIVWSQFLMRLELESICSSWIGIRKLLSERQIIKKNTVQRRRGRKREARDFSSFMDD